jgi:hypothetical protein
VAPDGTVFVATTTSAEGEEKAVVYRRKKAGGFDIVYEKPFSGTSLALSGRSATDLWISSRNVAHFDGSRWTDVETPAFSSFVPLTGSGPEVFISDVSGSQVYRKRGSTWQKEAVPGEIFVTQFFTGGSAVWALGTDASSRDVILQRSAAGTWAIKTPEPDSGTSNIRSAWVSPTGDVFVATDDGIARSSNGGTTWSTQETADPIDALWGRSNSDLYGASTSGLLRYDGKKWSDTSYSDAVTALSGTATEVLVLRADQ